MRSKITLLEVRALKNHICRRSARSKHIFLDYTVFLDSIDSTGSTDSIDIIDSIDSILVPHKETANIHTTHKGARARAKVPMGAARFARRPHRYFCSPFVCGVNVGGLFVWHKYRIYRIYNIYRVL